MGAQKKRAKKTNETKTVKSLLSHVVADDFFGTYATVISLILQSNGKRPRETKEVLKTLYENMVYLQQHFRIVPKLKGGSNQREDGHPGSHNPELRTQGTCIIEGGSIAAAPPTGT